MTEEAIYCANHPSKETSLRCNRCGKPICPLCAVQTPVGYRCRECVRGQQKIFETARSTDLPVAVVISGIGVGIAVAVLSYLSFWGLFIAPIVGGGLAEIVRWAVRGRRSRRLPLFAAIGGGLGVVVYLIFAVYQNLRWYFIADIPFDPSVLTGAGFIFLWPLVHGGLIISALYARLRGIRF